MPNTAITSARNQFPGTITSLTTGMVNTEVILDIGGGILVTAVITNTSAAALDLKVGGQAIALFKATWVIISIDRELRTSARNGFKGVIKSAKKGAVNAEIVVGLPGGQTIAAIVTNESHDALGLAEGLEVTALVKSSHVIIGVK
ncbi:MAG: TOBE domain-containing protein [Deltaproteobacteria bacterium]|jgi:molybdate transport system regulatory protein|nr:TOBE domain-containing protein [Deltaproteobacteria bacterium]